MKGVTALTKIRVRTKQLQKKHPGKKYRTLQKQAAAEYKSGSIPKTRKKPAKRKARVTGKRKYKVTHRVAKVGKVAGPKKRSSRKPRKQAVKVVHRTRTVTRYKTVRGPGSKTSTLLIVGGLAVAGMLAYAFLNKPSTTAAPAIVLTGNASRDNAAQNLVAYAQAANLGISAITNLINSINSWGDSSVISASSNVSSGTSHIGDIAVLPPSGGPSIHLG